MRRKEYFVLPATVESSLNGLSAFEQRWLADRLDDWANKLREHADALEDDQAERQRAVVDQYLASLGWTP